MRLTVLYLTFRPGGYDILADSLRHQTLQDYELIIIDDFWVDRRTQVKTYLASNGIPVAYIGKSKPKCFPDTRFNFINALNTGVLASKGEVILMLHDYTWLQPDSLQQWLQHEDLFKHKYCISGVARYWNREPLVYLNRNANGLISIWDADWTGSPQSNGWAQPAMWIGKPFEMFYAAIGYPLLLELNGFPECHDCDSPVYFSTEYYSKTVTGLGGTVHTDKTIVCDMLNHRLWKPSSLWKTIAENPQGSAQLRERPNCFNLKHHRRGDTFWE